MNSLKIYNRGHQNLLDAIKDLSEQAAVSGFVTGSWTTKDVLNHIAIYEELQLEAFQKILDSNASTPLHNEKAKGTFQEFNTEQGDKDQAKTWAEVLGRYNEAVAKLQQVIKKTSSQQLAKPDGTKWYGEPCSLEDVIALSFGHKKHHIAQIKLFRQNNKI